MSILVKPVFSCNFTCDYCYEKELHDAGNISDKFDFNKVITKMTEAYKSGAGQITFHGGEFLTLPKDTIERMLKIAYELQGSSCIQTNGYLIDDGIIDLFKQYKTTVGISLDGPWPLNLSRGCGNIKTRESQYNHIMENIKKLRKADISVGLITVIHKRLMGIENIKLYQEWMRELSDIGVHGRHNIIQCNTKETSALHHPSEQEAIEWFTAMADLVLSDSKYLWQPYRDIVDSLLGLGLGTCTFTQCDLQHASASYVVMGDGGVASCCRSSGSDGIMFLRAESYSNIRTQLLSMTPKQYGGCQGCKYWKICYGHCPGMSIDKDWRNRAEHCEILCALYEHIDKRIRGMIPNINLSVDSALDDYEGRNYNKQETNAFDSMLLSKTSPPSSWRARMRDKTYENMFREVPPEQQINPSLHKRIEQTSGLSHVDVPHLDRYSDRGHVIENYTLQQNKNNTIANNGHIDQHTDHLDSGKRR